MCFFSNFFKVTFFKPNADLIRIKGNIKGSLTRIVGGSWIFTF